MPFLTGTVNNMAEAETALVNGCIANGWVSEAAAPGGTLLDKGGCYVRVRGLTSPDRLLVIGGTGKLSADLTTPGPNTLYAKRLHKDEDVSFPATYFLHILTSPDEVYFIMKFGGDKYIYIAFGQSPLNAATLPGTGNWYAGSTAQSVSQTNDSITTGTTGATSSSNHHPGLFHGDQPAYGGRNNHFHHDLESLGWTSSTASGGSVNSTLGANILGELPQYQPNVWNGEAVLLPIPVGVYLSGSKWTIVGQLNHSRYLFNKHISDETVLTLGTDQWKVYPHYKRNTTDSIVSGDNHTWLLAMAIRYDGA